MEEYWLVPVGASMAASNACNNVQQVVQKYQSGELGDHLLAQEFAKAVLDLGIGIPRLNRWTPPPDLAGFKEKLLGYLARFTRANGQLLLSRDAAGYLNTIDEICPLITEARDEVVNKAIASGVADVIGLYARFASTPIDSLASDETPVPSSTASPIATAIPLSLAGTLQPSAPEPIHTGNALRLEEVARWGQGELSGSVLSPDGQMIALMRAQGVTFASGENFEMAAEITTPFEVNFAAFSRGNHLVAIGNRGGDIWLWNRDQSRRLQAFFFPDQIDALALAPAGDFLATGSYGWVYLQPADGSSPTPLFRTSDWSSITGLAFSPDGRLLAVGMPFGGIEIWEIESRSRIQEINTGLSVSNLIFSPDSAKLAGITSSYELVIWNVAGGGTWAQIQADFTGLYGVHTEPLLFDINQEWNKAAVLSEQGALRVHELPSGEPVDQIMLPEKDHQSPFFVAFTPQGDSLAALVADTTSLKTNFMIWSLADATVKSQWMADPAVTSLSVAENGQLAAVGLSDGLVVLRRAGTGLTALSLPKWHMQAVAGLQFTEQDTSLVSLSGGKNILRVWNPATGRPTLNIVDEEFNQFNIKFRLAPDGKSYTQLPMYRVPLRRDGSRVVASINSAGSAKVLYKLELKQKFISLTAVSYDGQSVVGYADGGYWLWSGPSQAARQIIVDEAAPEQMIFSPDGRWLAAATHTGDIKVWDTQSWQLVTQFAHKRREDTRLFPLAQMNQPGPVGALLFSQDGELLVSGGQDGEVRLWQVPGGKLLTALKPANLRNPWRHYEDLQLYPPIQALAFAADASCLYAGDFYGQVHVYAFRK